ncbi:GerAB/ArcD/ProY family transporter [Paenibacillus sp. D2_2]|uniref:GerAB/ArcD/ProY family transporter n=1 Tax=Paenibacillus sp. D2_2 TaxID=3073092 RepID=UPI002815407E|nr:GerAB/ArcD/ProY family transporter [Paenibacillus sp. D2_2]WMT42867.1 GerAB/ArcD/ProY family transporter [Paenibacillus sp. D2_2]
MPYLKSPQKTYKNIISALLFSLVIILMHMFFVLLAFGPEITSNMAYPDLELTSFIESGSFLQTVDPILIILWLTGLFIKVSFTIFITSFA